MTFLSKCINNDVGTFYMQPIGFIAQLSLNCKFWVTFRICHHFFSVVHFCFIFNDNYIIHVSKYLCNTFVANTCVIYNLIFNDNNTIYVQKYRCNTFVANTCVIYMFYACNTPKTSYMYYNGGITITIAFSVFTH